MKLLVLFFAIISANAFSSDLSCTDFSGTWIGSCPESDVIKFPNLIELEQVGCERLVWTSKYRDKSGALVLRDALLVEIGKNQTERVSRKGKLLRKRTITSRWLAAKTILHGTQRRFEPTGETFAIKFKLELEGHNKLKAIFNLTGHGKGDCIFNRY
ncbi:MAG: hypothetical protein HOE90_18305 [Bacteriovoracaceae bacterium]|jgi:hypothetical protein|nr:hypothetical protein [Bacteriovoracaceae bacterium]